MRIADEEDHGIEFKQSWNSTEMLKWVCGLANADGGRMFIGVRDDGEVIGLQNSKQLMEDIPNAIVSAFGMYDVRVFLRRNEDKKSRIIQNKFKTARGCYGEEYSSEYSNSEFDGLKVRSFPKWCGYSTYSISFIEDGMLKRRFGIDLLKSIINSRLMSKTDVIKFLTSLINMNISKLKSQDSVYVWESDLEEIKQFEPNESMKEVRYLYTLDKIEHHDL